MKYVIYETDSAGKEYLSYGPGTLKEMEEILHWEYDGECLEVYQPCIYKILEDDTLTTEY